MSTISLEKALSLIGRKDLTKTASAQQDYAFDDRDATLCSFARALVKQASELPKCREMARFWGIQDQCAELETKVASYKPAELTDDHYALVKQAGDQTIRKFAAFDSNSTVEASLALVNQRERYPLAWRKEAALRLLGKAEEYGAMLPDFVNQALHKTAGLAYPTAESAEELMVSRFNLVKQAEHQELLTKLASLLEHLIDRQELRHDESFVKAAVAAIEQFDAATGLTDRYEQGLPLPEDLLDITTDQLQKVASMKIAVTLVNGHTLPLEGLSKEALEAVDPELSKLASDELADILPTLPKGDADLLVRLTAE